ncbi:MAG: molybdopterin-dependent oxidoreductase [Chloroflexi bacterium]|nr:molybdopterin-dependent oxidoreductase [Chloroflexota bacterium]
MAMVNITINGQKVSAPAGSTVLEAAQGAGIDIPTLCHHPALAPIGACRMCLVEIKGQRTLQTACTFPVTEGMEVQTESPQVVQARKFVLDLLFSERNHYCMYCEMSGDCELQSLGYRYGVDHWVYPTYTKRFPVDATRAYFLMDHNRCILCRRCVRACSELVANHTLGVRQRGAESMIHADMNVPFGQSSCVSCGTCLQVCPTGALVDKRSAFMGRDVETEHIKSVCSQCSIGCGMEIVTRGGNVLRIEGDWDAPVNAGLLCQAGRFNPLYDERQRVTKPLLRQNGKLKETDWDTALEALAEQIRSTKGKNLGVLTTTNATNEALYLLGKLFREELRVTNIGLLNGVATKLSEKSGGSLADVTTSDIILVVSADPAKDQPVASFLVKRAVDKGARLIIVDSKDNGLAPFASMHLKMDEVNKAVELAERAVHPVVLYGPAITDKTIKALGKLGEKAVFIALEPGVNTYAAAAFGLSNGFDPSSAETVFVLVGEQDWDGKDMLKQFGPNAFVVVQTSYESPLTKKADVVLPMAIWSEREGTLTNIEGRVQQVNKAVEPKGEAKPDWEILSLLAGKLGKSFGTLDEISARAARELE